MKLSDGHEWDDVNWYWIIDDPPNRFFTDPLFRGVTGKTLKLFTFLRLNWKFRNVRESKLFNLRYSGSTNEWIDYSAVQNLLLYEYFTFHQFPIFWLPLNLVNDC